MLSYEAGSPLQPADKKSNTTLLTLSLLLGVIFLSASPLLTGLHPLRWTVSFVDEDVLVTFVTDVVTLVLVNGSGSQVIPKELHS